ncbi:cation transporter, partial [Campylobacter sp.]|uniref:cation transporter n=1 Tax=Campylobacter sp. TaxID=205 RepID=UPI00403E6DDA
MSSEITLSLGNLTCANCAAKIESKIADLPDIEQANLDFLGQKIFIKSKNVFK